MNNSIELLDQIIVIAEMRAKEFNALNLAAHRAVQTIGEDSVVFHLKNLRELLLLEQKPINTTEVIQGKEFIVSLGK